MVIAPNIIRTIKTSKGDATYSVYDFLDEIKSMPSIWQVGGIHHMNRTEYQNSWHNIAQKLISLYCDLDKEEQIEIVQNLRKFYGNLKNDLSLFLKYKKIGDKRYRLFNYGYKMAYVLQDRGLKVEDVFSQDEINEMKMFEQKFKQYYTTNKIDVAGENLDLIENFENKKAESITYNDERITQCVIDNVREQCKPKDPDQAFFDSLKPWLRQMNGEQMLDFKIRFLQTLKKYQN